MLDWFLSFCLLALIVALFFIALKCHRLRKAVWVTLFAIPGILWLCVKLAVYVPYLSFETPLSWFFVYRRLFVFSAMVVTWNLGILIPQAPGRRLRFLLCILLTIAITYNFIIPSFGPLLVRHRLRTVDSFMDGDVCLQSTEWTCGPASAVTALHALGIEADEGEMAILSYTAPIYGTNETLLARAIQKRYPAEHLATRYTRFSSITELKGHCPALVAIPLTVTVGHLVTVLEITDTTVVYGDPLKGKVECPIAEFEEKWFHTALLIWRSDPG
jgi:predicted double-glycine peptidase